MKWVKSEDLNFWLGKIQAAYEKIPKPIREFFNATWWIWLIWGCLIFARAIGLNP